MSLKLSLSVVQLSELNFNGCSGGGRARKLHTEKRIIVRRFWDRIRSISSRFAGSPATLLRAGISHQSLIRLTGFGIISAWIDPSFIVLRERERERVRNVKFTHRDREADAERDFTVKSEPAGNYTKVYNLHRLP